MNADLSRLLTALAERGGRIVCTSSLRTPEVSLAQVDGRLAIIDDGTAFVWLPNFLAIKNSKEWKLQ